MSMHSPLAPLSRFRSTALLALLATSAFATVIVHETLDDLARRVPVIARGRVMRSFSAWDDGKRSIYTWTELSVTDPIKGKPGAVVLIKSYGGEVDGIGQMVAGAATFKEGEDCVVFLEPAPNERGSYMVSGLSAGKILMTTQKGQPTAVRDTTGIAFARPASGKVAERVLTPEFLGSPDDFVKRIRKAIAGGAK
jgi:hypothetical protein